jgi:hypothetical protein
MPVRHRLRADRCDPDAAALDQMPDCLGRRSPDVDRDVISLL